MRGRLAPTWLTERPIAHRGLHGAPTGFVENSLPAAQAAVASGYAIECDVQLSRDGEAMVFHDFDLDRLTGANGRLADRTALDLAAIGYRDGAGAIPTLPTFLAAVGGRVPVIVEIKSAFDRDLRLADRAQAVVAAYDGPAALKSFDAEIVAHLRAADPAMPIGLVAEAPGDAHTPALPDATFFRDVPDFLSWNHADFPHPVPALCRAAGVPVMTWTVRSQRAREAVATFADQIVFEGFRP